MELACLNSKQHFVSLSILFWRKNIFVKKFGQKKYFCGKNPIGKNILIKEILRSENNLYQGIIFGQK